MAGKTANERFYNSMATLCGWVLFVGLPISATVSIWTSDWRIFATAFVGLLTLAGIAVGAKLLVNDEKTAADD